MLDEWNPFFSFQIICLLKFSSDFSWENYDTEILGA
jgi:hypothetical protein